MTREQYTTKQRKFQHLTREKRAQIEILLRQGLPKVQIAQAVGISRSTLYHELSRGTVEQIDTNLKKYRRYFGDAGQRVYEENRKNSRPPMKIMKAYDFVRRLNSCKRMTSCDMRRSKFLKARCRRMHSAERQG